MLQAELKGLTDYEFMFGPHTRTLFLFNYRAGILVAGFSKHDGKFMVFADNSTKHYKELEPMINRILVKYAPNSQLIITDLYFNKSEGVVYADEDAILAKAQLGLKLVSKSELTEQADKDNISDTDSSDRPKYLN